MLDRVIFGDNQFFGINHMSEEKAQALAERFRNVDAIMEVIDIAYDAGIRAFMLNTNERAMDICDRIRADPVRYADMVFYPSMPYAHKYANAVAEKGIFGALRDTLTANSTAGEVIAMLARGGTSLFEKDMIKVMQLLVDIEMKIFRGLNVRVIFLQNIVTDLLLGFGVKDVFKAFRDHVVEKYGVRVGFVTMNLPRMIDWLPSAGIEDAVVCSAINKAGYFMNPSLGSYERALGGDGTDVIAMSVLASGAVKPEAAIDYVSRFPAVKAVVFGASSRRHIEETRALIQRSFSDNVQPT